MGTMKPLRLIMQAYGPFAGRQVVDFRELGENTFFNVGGATGSGKTSILDAFCYAPLGEASGRERTARSMRSDHAAPGLRTEVTLDFQISAKTYRVTRSPEQDRPKKVGEGFTLEGAAATLWDRTGLVDDAHEGVVLATGATQVTKKAQELVGGLTLDQLRQTAILAQGEFRKVITADSKERAGILGRLFETAPYGQLERRLRDGKNQLLRALEDSQRDRNTLLQEADVESTEALVDIVQTLEETVKRSEEKARELQNKADEARKALEEGKADKARLDEVAQATNHHTDLITQRPAIDAKQVEYERAEAARALRDVDASRAQRIVEQNSAEKALQDAELLATRATQAAETAEKRMKTEKARDPERLQAQQKLDQLRGLAQRVKALADTQADVAAAKTRVEMTVKDQTVAEEELAKRRDQHVSAVCQLTAAKLDAEGLENTKKALEAQRQTVTNRKDLDAKRAGLATTLEQQSQAQNHLQTVRQQVEAARAVVDSLQATRMKGHAALLAEALEDGFACPVCGSEEHPNLAEAHGTMPTEDDLEVALQAQRTAEETLETGHAFVTNIAVTIAKCEASIETLMGQLKEAADTPLDNLVVQEKRLEAVCERSQNAARSLVTRQQTLDKLALSVTKAEDTLKETTLLLSTNQQGLKAAEAILHERESEVPQKIRPPGALGNAVKTAQEHLETLKIALVEAEKSARASAEKLSECKARVETLAKTLKTGIRRTKQAQAEFVTRVAEAKFKDVTDYKSARRDDLTMATLSKIIEQFKEALAKAIDRVERALKAAESLKAPDLEGLRQTFESTHGALAIHQESLGDLRNTFKSQTNRLQKLQQIAKGHEATHQQYEIIGRLADVAWGDNGAGLTFERYVLAAMLDDVLIATNQRLHTMTSGRFTLHRTQEVRTRKGRHGLDLDVLDAYTGKSRPAYTLSGGEGFEAALSLALGLADTVQSQAGGIHLDTIFVDEGFGSLGPEDLDAVMGALEDLQEGGRLVGVISHVPEVAERIPARLEVEKGAEGSTARFILP